MENGKSIKLIIFILIMGTFLMFPFFVMYAYSPETTHSALTQEIVRFFNIHNQSKAFSQEEMMLIMQGSIDEDDGTRPLQHFYDPVYDRGLVLGTKRFQKSKEWVNDIIAQASYSFNTFSNPVTSFQYGTVDSLFGSNTDYTWERAIYEYVWGDKKYALLALGHVLHLLEDASVPDHTRNDPHPPVLDLGSPYEFWTKKFSPSNFNIVNDLVREKPIRLNNLEESFEILAQYSNSNFFSKDTVFSGNYKNPRIKEVRLIKLSDGQFYRFGYGDIDGKKYKLLLLNSRELGQDMNLNLIKDTDNLILTDYWNLLSKQTVLHGAGVLELFFDEVEKERQTKTLFNKNKSWISRFYEKTKENVVSIFNNPFTSSIDPVTQLANPNTPEIAESQSQIDPPIENEIEIVNLQSNEQNPPNTPSIESEIQEQNIVEEINISPIIIQEIDTNTTERVTENGPTPYQPGFGGGGGPHNNNPENSDKDEENQENPTEPEEIETQILEAPTILSPDETQTIFTTDSLLFSGTGEASSTIEIMYERSNQEISSTTTTTVNNLGEWNINVLLDQGTTTLTFLAYDDTKTSSIKERSLFVDSISPDVVLSDTVCAISLSEEDCLLTTTTATFFWSSNAEDLAHFLIDENGVISATTATSTTIITENDGPYTFGVSAVDVFGNVSPARTKVINISTSPVVINEIAWAGTGASPSDEWIELYNTTPFPINVSDSWTLFSQDDNSPNIELSGIIPAKGYYLIERKNNSETDELTESPVIDIEADLWVSFGVGLRNNGEELVLTHGSTTIDSVTLCGRRWCGGSSRGSSGRVSMERYDPLISGTENSNWGSNNGFIKNGIDTKNDFIKGTPKARNSINYQIANGTTLTQNKTLTKENSPYIITSSGFTVRPNTTLTLDPGVVIKLISANEPSFIIEGALKTQGTAEEPVVITSFVDDEYGGDFNRDGICEPSNASSTAQCPLAGGWKQLLFRPSSSGSALEHTIVRYGGRYFTNMLYRAVIVIEDASVSFDNVIVEHSKKHGIYLANGTSTITNSILRNNNQDNTSTGFFGSGGITIENSLFENNTRGLNTSSAQGFVSNNIFKNNSSEAILIGSPFPILMSNTGSGNGQNAIIIRGNTITEPNETTTLNPNTLPYLLKGDLHVVSSSTLTFQPGTVIKGMRGGIGAMLIIDSGGTLFYDGTSSDDVLFTSETDNRGGVISDEFSVPQAGDWYGVRVSSGGIFDMNGFTLSYAGKQRGRGGIRAGLVLEDMTTSTILNALVHDNLENGILLHNDGSLILKNTEIKNHTERQQSDATGLHVIDSNVDLQNVIFTNNTRDIKASGAYTLTADSLTKTQPLILDPLDLFK